VLTDQVGDPVTLARRFSPSTNGGLRQGETALRVLIATDVLAEGQNLQDAHIVVNYDLPWAIVRLIQRAGRVDRIGQKHDTILVSIRFCLPKVSSASSAYASGSPIGSSKIRRSSARMSPSSAKQPLHACATCTRKKPVRSTRKAPTKTLTWQALPCNSGKALLRTTEKPPLLYHGLSQPRALASMKQSAQNPPGVVAYLRYPDGIDALIRVDEQGNLVSQSLSVIFRTISCAPDTPAMERTEDHHALVARCVEIATEGQVAPGGQLSGLRSVRRKLWDRLNQYRRDLQRRPNLFSSGQLQQLDAALDLIWRYPLKSSAQEAVSRQMRLGISDSDFLDLVACRAEEGSLCEMNQEEASEPSEPQIICSLGLVEPKQGGKL
jgi:hypothetical protein